MMLSNKLLLLVLLANVSGSLLVSMENKRLKKSLLNLKIQHKHTCKEKYTTLIDAANNGCIGCCHKLLKKGADLEQADENGFTPLHYACFKSYTEIVKLLLAHGANSNKATNQGFSPLHFACYNGHIETVKLLIEWPIFVLELLQTQCSVNTDFRSRAFAFLLVLKRLNAKTSLPLVPKFIRAEILKHSCDWPQLTPRIWKSNNPKQEAINIVIEMVNQPNNKGYTPLRVAQEMHPPEHEVVKLLEPYE